MNTALELLNLAVLKDHDIKKYKTLPSIHDRSYFLQHSTDEEKVDTSIIFLTLVSYMLPKKVEIVKLLKQTMNQITYPLIELKNPLLESRLSLFLGYYIDILYGEQDELFLEVLKMLVNSINSKNKAAAY